MKLERNYYKFRVTWENTDTAGYMHNSVVFRYFDRGELEWFRSLGIHWQEFSDRGFPRIHVEADFIRPLYFDDECILETIVTRIRPVKVELTHRIMKDNKTAIVGKVVFCCISMKDRKPKPIPKKMIEILTERLKK